MTIRQEIKEWEKLWESYIKKETLAQVFSCEFCEISKSKFSPIGDSSGK